jgi:hypothetical protein
MDQEAFDQTTADIEAYIGSLDAREALGEIEHLTANYQRAGGLAATGAINLAPYAQLYLPLVLMLCKRLSEGDGGLQPIPPPHDGSVHTCTLIARTLTARL